MSDSDRRSTGWPEPDKHLYRRAYTDGDSLHQGIKTYSRFYNHERRHHPLGGLATFDWRRFLGTFEGKPEVSHEKRRVFDEAFKRMACPGVPVELPHAKGSVQEAARELGINSIALANRSDH